MAAVTHDMSDTSGTPPPPAADAPAAAGTPTRVALVDDHEVLCEALAHVMGGEPDLEVTGVAHDLAGARSLIADTAPDVVLLDHRLPDGDGVAAIPRLRALQPAAAFVVLTATATEGLLAVAMRNGASGLVSKARGLEEVTVAVRSAAAGEVVVFPDLGSELVDRLEPEASGVPGLTAREREVLGYLADGLSNAEIARKMTVSIHTARNHVANLSAKLGARSRLEALSIAVRRGLLPGP